MGFTIGLGIGIGTSYIGGDPPLDLDAPSSLIESLPSIVVVGAEVLNLADLATLVTSKTVHFNHHADAGVVESGGAGTGVTQFTDTTAAAKHATAAGTARSTLTANGGPGGTGYNALTFNGTTNGMNIAVAVTPGTVPFFRRTLARVTTGFTTGAQLTCGSSTNRLGIRITTGPVAGAGNGVNGGTIAISLATWYLFDEYYSNSTADYLRIGALTAATGVNLTNTAASSLGLGSNSAAAGGFFKGDIVWSFACNGLPTTAELNAQALLLQKWHGVANIQVPTYP